MIKRITYVSRFAKAMSEPELESLGKAAAAKNKELDVTGVLMSSGGLFYQVLEGPPEAVDDLYATIAADSRHADLLLLRSEADAAGRMFADWSMKTINLDAESHKRLLPLKALVKGVVEQQRLIENMMWAIERTLQYEMKS